MKEIITAAVIAAVVSVMIHLAKDAIRDAYFKNVRRTTAREVMELLEVNSEYKDGELFIRLDDAIEIIKKKMN